MISDRGGRVLQAGGGGEPPDARSDDEDGCASWESREVAPGEAALGLGVGLGVELGGCVDDGYFALTAVDSIDAMSIGDATGYLHTRIFGIMAGPCLDD